MMRLGEEGVRQGAEERSSLLSKLLFSRQTNLKFFSWLEMFTFCEDSYTFRYQGRCKGSVSDKGKMKSPFSFLSLSLPGSRSSSPAPQTRHSSHIQPSKQVSELLFTPRTTSLVQSGRALERPHSTILSAPISSPASEKVTPQVNRLECT